MTNVRLQTKMLCIAFSVITLFTSKSFGQWIVTYTPSNQDGGFNSFTSSDFADDAYYEQQRQNRANSINLSLAHQIEIDKFDQKLLISANVVQSMKAYSAHVSKYPYALALYKRSLESFKKLEPISVSAAETIKHNHNSDIDGFKNQQNQIMNAAVDDYHKGQYVQELGENKVQLIQEEKMTFIAENCLTKEEKSEYNVLKVQIKDAQHQIAQLHQSGQSMDQIKDQLENDYHVLAQSFNSVAKISEDVLKIYAPNQKVVKVINVTQKVFDTYVDEAYANGKSPSEAIEKAFEEGYKELKKEQQDQKKTPSEKKIEVIKTIFDGIQKEAENWQKMDEKRSEAMEKINEAIDFTNDIVQRNQKLIDAAAAKGNKMTQRCIDNYVKRRLN